MDKLTFLCSTALVFNLILGCAGPTDIENGKFPARTPEELTANLKNGYGEENLQGYLNSFSDDCIFLSGGDYLWGKADEQKIHQRLFAAAKSIELRITEALNEEQTAISRRSLYHYYLVVQLANERTLEAQGMVELGLAKGSAGNWQINSFGELGTGLQKPVQAAPDIHETNNAADYFPLHVGNTWLYKDRLIVTRAETLRTTVTDSVLLHGERFYRVKNNLYKGFELIRLDSLKLKNFVEEDSTEKTILDFNASIVDTLFLTFPWLPYPFIVEFLGEKNSVTVPAGTFENVKEFMITDENSGSRFLYEFAEGVGLIRQRGTNTINELISAKVNDVIVTIETPHLSWTKIKSSFH